MALTISSNAQLVGSLFSGMSSRGTNNFTSSLFSSSDMLGINYMDYASIKSGSYYKLLDAYYSLDKTSDSTKTSATDKTKDKSDLLTTAKTTDSASKLAALEEKSEKLGDAADALTTVGNKSLFKTTTKTDENGKTTTVYDTDKIYQAVRDFADQYNSLYNSASTSKVKQISNAAASMVNYTASNEKLLSSMGVTIDEETKNLKIDEEAFKKTDMSKVKGLFNGSGSYAYQVSVKASMINYHAQHEASKANTYTKAGGYSNNYSSGSIWDSMI